MKLSIVVLCLLGLALAASQHTDADGRAWYTTRSDAFTNTVVDPRVLTAATEFTTMVCPKTESVRLQCKSTLGTAFVAYTLDVSEVSGADADSYEIATDSVATSTFTSSSFDEFEIVFALTDKEACFSVDWSVNRFGQSSLQCYYESAGASTTMIYILVGIIVVLLSGLGVVGYYMLKARDEASDNKAAATLAPL
ncbi:hypothetical protein KIPB_004473 [Kipferlia bialata]|uniref:Uncharacterized protein n=1 Tax=Kipferlia bialata TaxID=797122 RepID=A0A9K3CVH4_9EUKA|nr:hypothetical protein KIPB_004473 [Kipferlia bialata]|eukprot:g4473.t1